MAKDSSIEIKHRLLQELEGIVNLLPLIREYKLPDEVEGFFEIITERINSAEQLARGLTNTSSPIADSLRILLVDDDELQHVFVRRVLEKSGIAFQGVKNGSDALRILERQTFDLILLDCQLPKLDGFEITRLIRAREASNPSQARTPVVAYTGHGMAGYRQRCIQAGMDGYLRKPVAAADLVRQVQELSSQRTQLGSARAS